ncbi:uncharacterized protein FOMMEDRAFT_27015 [Fomitiporia mediterranea MF3/22]|uniref:uncharacterized protein n=1 Tax=Fomitiporia mediterranea (strain MF3/22) TaxID=694068 RepID=UPI0004407F6A|nr:uncharacterized protein FOMMEDRAFT_27015 [Fomitiporia mediterranea MF3/22]EJD04672.1 hypothetical protein FOMMEDRAFT_27015 [Fomitiporia mediterranea MF3/22]
MYRDVKPKNFLIKDKCDNPTKDRLLLSDFRFVKYGEDMKGDKFCRTPTFLAPEIYKLYQQGWYTEMINIWLLGELYNPDRNFRMFLNVLLYRLSVENLIKYKFENCDKKL